MYYKNKQNLFSLSLLILLLVLIPLLPGCAKKETKKPLAPPKLAPEVARIKSQEPTITLYRYATGGKESLPLEQYIKGVVAAEIGDEFPMEALKAQAVVARTMTMALIAYEGGTRKLHNTDASDNHTEFQAYDPDKITDKISKAVDATRGQFLISDKGKFVYALFHSASKDKTADITESFPKLKNKASYLVSVPTNGLKNAPDKYKKWTVKVPRSQVRAIMGSKAGSLDDIRISKRGPSGRALTIAAGKASISAVELREKIGFDRLFSTQLSRIYPQGGYIVFEGSGWGHGAGMEQWGAYTMAKEGKKFSQIIAHYFPKAKMIKLYD